MGEGEEGVYFVVINSKGFPIQRIDGWRNDTRDKLS